MNNPSPLEKDIQKVCLDYLQRKGFFVWKNSSTGIFDPTRKIFRTNAGMKGIPDLIGLLPDGRFLGVEIKRPENHLSAGQKIFHERIAENNGIAIVVHSLEELIADLKELKP